MTRFGKARFGFTRFRLRVEASLRARLGLQGTTYVDRRVGEYRGYWEAAARALSAEFVSLSETIWEVRRNGVRTRLSNYVTELDNPVTLRIAGDKALVYAMAEVAGVPVPRHVSLGSEGLKEALDFLARVGGPCVVKPARNTSSGKGITTSVSTSGTLERAFARASLYGPEIIVERHVPGESYRLLFLDGQLIHAVRRSGTRVIGDGVATVASLMRTQAGLLMSQDSQMTLKAQDLAGTSVPENGTPVLVRGLPQAEFKTEELRTVYDEEVTELLHPELIGEIQPVIEAIGVSFAGLDIITTDPNVPLRESGGAFIELNTTPGIHHHYVPVSAGEGPPVAEVVLRRLLNIDPMIQPEVSGR